MNPIPANQTPQQSYVMSALLSKLHEQQRCISCISTKQKEEIKRIHNGSNFSKFQAYHSQPQSRNITFHSRESEIQAKADRTSNMAGFKTAEKHKNSLDMQTVKASLSSTYSKPYYNSTIFKSNKALKSDGSIVKIKQNGHLRGGSSPSSNSSVNEQAQKPQISVQIPGNGKGLQLPLSKRKNQLLQDYFTQLVKTPLSVRSTKNQPQTQQPTPKKPFQLLIGPSLANLNPNRQATPKVMSQSSSMYKLNKDQVQLSQYITQIENKTKLAKPVGIYVKDSGKPKNSFEFSQQLMRSSSQSSLPQQKQESFASVPILTYYIEKMMTYLTGEFENDPFAQLYKEHFQQTFQSLGYLSGKAPDQSDSIILESKNVDLPPNKFEKTVILDLDETLIHCNATTLDPADVILTIEFPNGDTIDAGINIRPHLSSLCEVIVFTASHSCYANKVIDYLDPTGKLIHHRLFRESCVTTDEGVHIKDLSIFSERDLKDVVLVDNAAYSFGYQLDNGIPIIPFYDNKKDTELLDLLEYLKQLLSVPDVRVVNRKHFKMHAYSKSSSIEDAIEKVYFS